MVDPELGRAARERLPDPPRPILAAEPAPPRRRIRLGLLSSAAGVAALGVLLTLVVGRQERPARRAQTQSVAAAVSPTNSAPTTTAPATSTPAHATDVPGQTFVWVTSPDAAAYEFQLFQGGERVFRARVDEARLELPGRWRLAGRPHALLPGTYRWYVWAISKRTNQRSTKPTVSAKLVVDEQPR
jgi:hypothetical protein